MNDSAAAPAVPDREVKLTDVMLAMDVVDTLRHEESLIERAMNAEAREQLLVERVRNAYRAQGIEVSDDIIAEGVKALKEKQFTYQPPPPGFKTRLLKAWTRRDTIGRGLGLFIIVAAVISTGYYGFVELPRQRTLMARVAMQEQLPGELSLLKTEATELAVEPHVDALVSRIYERSMAALRLGDVEAADHGVSELKDLLLELELEYTVSVVSRPGELSAVIRAPNDNWAANNYYLIVEALSRSGSPLKIALRSEEDGGIETVSSWGVRVDEAVFEQVKVDKSDDGIIQNRNVGAKQRGYLKPQYTISVRDGFITTW